jgi:hypothetical protein
MRFDFSGLLFCGRTDGFLYRSGLSQHLFHLIAGRLFDLAGGPPPISDGGGGAITAGCDAAGRVYVGLWRLWRGHDFILLSAKRQVLLDDIIFGGQHVIILLFGSEEFLFTDVFPLGRRVFDEASKFAAKYSGIFFLLVLSAAFAAPIWNTKHI